MSTTERYVPAAGFSVFTRYFDPVLALTMREGRWRPVLRDRVLAGVPSGGSVVDVGAGTGTLAIALAAARPDVEVVGVDGDPEVLALARAKPGSDAVRWEQGLAGELALDAASADAVVMSLVLHHLSPATKRRALADIAQVLKPGGALHVADWGPPHDPLMRGAFLVTQLVDGFENTRDHPAGRLPSFFEEAGLRSVQRYDRLRTPFGSLELLEARS